MRGVVGNAAGFDIGDEGPNHFVVFVMDAGNQPPLSDSGETGIERLRRYPRKSRWMSSESRRT